MVYLGGFDFCQIFLSQSELKVLHEYKWMLLLLHCKNMFAFLCKTCIGWECDMRRWYLDVHWLSMYKLYMQFVIISFGENKWQNCSKHWVHNYSIEVQISRTMIFIFFIWHFHTIVLKYAYFAMFTSVKRMINSTQTI